MYFSSAISSPCENSPCQNGGICSSIAGVCSGYQCSCQDGFAGVNCEDGKCLTVLSVCFSPLPLSPLCLSPLCLSPLCLSPFSILNLYLRAAIDKSSVYFKFRQMWIYFPMLPIFFLKHMTLQCTLFLELTC